MKGNIRPLLTAVVCACAVVCMAAPTAIWLDVPFVKQDENGCGAASIAMVMQFWQRRQGLSPNADSDVRRIQRSLYSAKAHGIYASDLERYFGQRGYRVYAFEGGAADLQQHLAKGRPLIVTLKPEGGGTLHYVVVAGFDGEHNLVLLNDPAERKLLKREIGNFEKEWKGAGHWTLLAVPQAEGAFSAP
jgi:ABC-type bacteriocin/lantibiotic exporter with double-glycine peptidase domain